MTRVDAVRYSFIVMDLHHLLLAGLPAHSASPPEATAIADIRTAWLLTVRDGGVRAVFWTPGGGRLTQRRSKLAALAGAQFG